MCVAGLSWIAMREKGISRLRFTSLCCGCGKQLDDIYTLWPPEPWAWGLDSGTRFPLPLQISFCLQMGQCGTRAVSLNANTAWVACYWGITVSFYQQYCCLPCQFPCSAIIYDTSKAATQTRYVYKCHQVSRNDDWLQHLLFISALCTIGHTRITEWSACRNRSRQTLAPLICSKLAWSKPDPV